eukprot:12219-Pelagococcus_subviridis.AAC.1
MGSSLTRLSAAGSAGSASSSVVRLPLVAIPPRPGRVPDANALVVPREDSRAVAAERDGARGDGLVQVIVRDVRRAKRSGDGVPEVDRRRARRGREHARGLVRRGHARVPRVVVHALVLLYSQRGPQRVVMRDDAVAARARSRVRRRIAPIRRDRALARVGVHVVHPER